MGLHPLHPGCLLRHAFSGEQTVAAASPRDVAALPPRHISTWDGQPSATTPSLTHRLGAYRRRGRTASTLCPQHLGAGAARTDCGTYDPTPPASALPSSAHNTSSGHCLLRHLSDSVYRRAHSTSGQGTVFARLIAGGRNDVTSGGPHGLGRATNQLPWANRCRWRVEPCTSTASGTILGALCASWRLVFQAPATSCLSAALAGPP